MQTASISELQKSPKSVFEKKGITWILKNNQVHGGVFDKCFADFVTESNIQDMYEDWKLMNDPEAKVIRKKVISDLEKGDMSDYVTLDQL